MKAWDQFKKYLFEVVAIITAITLSFLFDEWRDGRRDRRDNRELLTTISDNLKKTRHCWQPLSTFRKK
jgi:hypothetical protein